MKNKIFKIILLIFTIIFVLSLLFINNNIMTRNEIIKLIKSAQKINSYYSIMKNNANVTIETWKNGNNIYIKNDNVEEFHNIEKNETYRIDNSKKEITINNTLINDPNINAITKLETEVYEYEYLGKETINERMSYKFKLFSKSIDNSSYYEKTYWIDAQTGLHLKTFRYSTSTSNELVEEYTNYYTTTNSIKKFNANYISNYKLIK